MLLKVFFCKIIDNLKIKIMQANLFPQQTADLQSNLNFVQSKHSEKYQIKDCSTVF